MVLDKGEACATVIGGFWDPNSKTVVVYRLLKHVIIGISEEVTWEAPINQARSFNVCIVKISFTTGNW